MEVQDTGILCRKEVNVQNNGIEDRVYILNTVYRGSELSFFTARDEYQLPSSHYFVPMGYLGCVGGYNQTE